MTTNLERLLEIERDLSNLHNEIQIKGRIGANNSEAWLKIERLENERKSLKSQIESKLAQAQRKQNKPTFDIEIGREPVFALDGDYDVANYRLVSDIYETEKEALQAKKNLENITRLYEDNKEFFAELQKKIDRWESQEQELSQLRPIVRSLRDVLDKCECEEDVLELPIRLRKILTSNEVKP